VPQSGLSVPASAEVEKYYIKSMKTRRGMSGHRGYDMTAGGEVGGRGVPDEVSWNARFSDYLAFLAKFNGVFLGRIAVLTGGTRRYAGAAKCPYVICARRALPAKGTKT